MAYNTERMLPSQFSELISAIGSGGGGGGGTISFDATQFAELKDAIGHKDVPAEYVTYGSGTAKSALDLITSNFNNITLLNFGGNPSAVTINSAVHVPLVSTAGFSLPPGKYLYFYVLPFTISNGGYNFYSYMSDGVTAPTARYGAYAAISINSGLFAGILDFNTNTTNLTLYGFCSGAKTVTYPAYSNPPAVLLKIG